MEEARVEEAVRRAEDERAEAARAEAARAEAASAEAARAEPADVWRRPLTARRLLAGQGDRNGALLLEVRSHVDLPLRVACIDILPSWMQLCTSHRVRVRVRGER